MAHTIPYSNSQIDGAIGVGVDIHDANGVIVSNGAGNISVKGIDATPTENSTNLVESGGVFLQLQTLTDGKAPVITDTASGAIASFPDGADSIPVESLISYINPLQDLHGQANPYPPGGGKNMVSGITGIQSGGGTITDGIFTSEAKTGTYINLAYLQFSLNKTFNTNDEIYVSFDMKLNSGTGAYNDMALYIPNSSTSGAIYTRTAVTTPAISSNYQRYNIKITFTQDNQSIGVLYIQGRNATSMQISVANLMVSTSADATFAPYSNECPISGYTEMNITREGVNLWDEEWEQGKFDANGAEQPSSSSIRSKNYTSVIGGKSYYAVYPSSVDTSGNGMYLYQYDVNKNFITRSLQNTDNGLSITLNSNTAYVRFYMSGNYGLTYNHDISINYPSTETAYHAYNGETYSISWQDDAGTIFGGQYEAVLQKAKKTYDKVVFTGADTESWAYNSTNNYFVITLSDMKSGTYFADDNVICDTFPKVQYFGGFGVRFGNGDQAIYFTGVDTLGISTTVAAWKAWLAENNVSIIIPLANPVEYSPIVPTPETITTLLGQNNIFNDTNGNVDVTYPADTKLFILKAIGA